MKGLDKFVNDTLIQGKELTATVDLFSLFKSDGYTVDKIILDQSKVNAIILADGKVNWDIMKEDDDSDKKEEEDTDDDSSFALEIKKVEVNKFNLIFNDQEGFNDDFEEDDAFDFDKMEDERINSENPTPDEIFSFNDELFDDAI